MPYPTDVKAATNHELAASLSAPVRHTFERIMSDLPDGDYPPVVVVELALDADRIVEHFPACKPALEELASRVSYDDFLKAVADHVLGYEL